MPHTYTTVVGGKQGRAPCEILPCAIHISLISQVCPKDERNLTAVAFWDIAGFKIVASVFIRLDMCITFLTNIIL